MFQGRGIAQGPVSPGEVNFNRESGTSSNNLRIFRRGESGMPTATKLTRIVVLLCWSSLLGGLLGLARAAAAQNVFQVNVNLVNLRFVARDSQGKLVGNLTADDIELFEDAV